MDVPVSDSLRTLLARQDMRGIRLAPGRAEKVASAPMREGTGHSPIGRVGGGPRPMGNSGKGPDAETPGQVFGDGNKQPSPANRPVALRLVASNTLSATSKPVELNLVLIRGGLE